MRLWHVDRLVAVGSALACALWLDTGSARAEAPPAGEPPAAVEEAPPGDASGGAGPDGAAPEPADAPVVEPGSMPEDEAAVPAQAPGQRGTIDVVHGAISTGILATAEWLDSFFDDPRFAAEENRTRVKAGADLFLEHGSGPDLTFPISLRLRLPELQHRARIVVTGTPEQELEGQASRDTPTAATQLPGAQDRSVTTALDYFFLATERHNFGTRVGVRFREGEPEAFVQPRYRYLLPLDPWALRFTEDVRWWTEFGWESTTTVDLERPVGERLFFRTSAQLAWTEQEEGYYYSLSFVLRQPLSPRRVLQYELTNGFQSEPANQLLEVRATVRYRQKMWRDWMFFEIAPQASFRRERDFDLAPGVLLRFEMIFGHVKDADL